MTRKAPPFQVVLIMAFVGVLMLISWLTISSPEAREETKALTTLDYFLEAAGKVPVEKIGKEIHPTTRRTYNHETLKQNLADLGLDKPVSISDWSEGKQTFSPRQWEWDFKNHGEQMHAFLQFPEEMKISRRWHVRSLCRPKKDLVKASDALHQSLIGQAPVSTLFIENKRSESFSKEANATRTGFRMGAVDEKNLRSQITVGEQTWVLQWRMTPGTTLNCHYELENYRLKPNPQKGAAS